MLREHRLSQWRRGIAQNILYLTQCQHAYGTYLGLFVLSSEFQRLLAYGDVIFVEVCYEHASSNLVTIQNFLESGLDYSSKLAHDLALPPRPHSNATPDPLDHSGLDVLWEHCSVTRDIVQAISLSSFPSRLSPPPSGCPSWAACAVEGPQPSLDPLDLLTLVGTAHPHKYPAWWVKEKMSLIKQGRPDQPVSRPPSRKKSRSDEHSGSGRGGNNSKGGGRGAGSAAGGHQGGQEEGEGGPQGRGEEDGKNEGVGEGQEKREDEGQEQGTTPGESERGVGGRAPSSSGR